MSEPKPLASGLVDIVAGVLTDELRRYSKAQDVDKPDVARRVVIEILDELERRGVPFGPRPVPPPLPPMPDGGGVAAEVLKAFSPTTRRPRT